MKSVKWGMFFIFMRTKHHTTPALLLTPLKLVYTEDGDHIKWQMDAAIEKRNGQEK